MATRAGRKKNQLPDCYHEGFLEKKSFKDKTSQKLWACLCGDALFFFNNKRDNDYTEKVDLAGFISITDDSSLYYNLEAAKFTLQMKHENIKLSAPNAESREIWKGFIQSVAELSVPSSLNLLPGQIHMMKQVVEKEKDRIKSILSTTDANCNPYVSVQTEMPKCYYPVSRVEAELLLDREAKRGNLLLRPRNDGTSFAASTRQELDRAIYRHYLVNREHEGGFVIAAQKPVHCATLQDIVTYFVDATDGILIPLIIEGHYEKIVIIVSSDNESGEKMEQVLPNATQPPRPEPAPKPAAVEKMKKKESKTEDLPPVPPRKPGKNPPTEVLMPPTPAPRKGKTSTLPHSFTSSTDRDPRRRANPDSKRQSDNFRAQTQAGTEAQVSGLTSPLNI